MTIVTSPIPYLLLSFRLLLSLFWLTSLLVIVIAFSVDAVGIEIVIVILVLFVCLLAFLLVCLFVAVVVGSYFTPDLWVEQPRIATVGAAARADCDFGKNALQILSCRGWV